MNQTTSVWRNVEQQYRVAAYRTVVNVHQVGQWAYTFILVCMVEPSRTNRYVHFRRIPVSFLSLGNQFTATQVLRHVVDTQCSHRFVLFSIWAWSHRSSTPFSITAHTAFVTYPTYVVAHDSCYCLWLEFTNLSEDSCPVVFLLLTVRTFTASTVEPYFVYFAVVAEKFCQLFNEEFVISWWITIRRSVSIPRRKIYTKLHAVFFTSVTEFTNHVALTILPWRVLYWVFSSFSLPQTETIVMLGGDQCHLETTIFQSFHPLFAIEFRRVEDFRTVCTVSPFVAGKRIHAEVQKGSEFHLLPFQLLRCRNQAWYHINLLFRSCIDREGYMLFVEFLLRLCGTTCH